MIKLSLCMSTFKRGSYLAETLDSILPQLSETVELIIVDGASPDDTQEVVQPYLSAHDNIRYYRELVNSGIDADYDKAVGYSAGEFCWLVCDDDLLVEGAVARVLKHIEDSSIQLLVVDIQHRDMTLARVLQPTHLGFDEPRFYGADDADRLLADAGKALTYIGCVIIRRDVWISRERRAYYGSEFVHVGVVLQLPHLTRVLVLPKTMVILRLGNQQWTPRAFEIWSFKWPNLIWGCEGFSDDAKSAVTPRRPYLELPYLLLNRALGFYGLQKYRQFFRDETLGRDRPRLLLVALLPGRTLNLLVICRLAWKGKLASFSAFLLLRSRFSNWASRAVATFASPSSVEQRRGEGE